MKQETLTITGMSCAGCVGSVESALQQTPGISTAVVNLATNKATVTFDEASLSLDAVASAVVSAGYGVETETTVLGIGGMSCASCVSHVTSALEAVSGVQSATVNLATEKATITHLPLDGQTLTEAVTSSGFTVSEETQAVREDVPEKSLYPELLTAAICSTALMLLGTATAHNALSLSIIHPMLAVLTTIVMFWSGRSFLTGFLSGLRHRTANMNSLISVGTLSAYWYSLVITVDDAISEASGAQDLYFDTAAMIITFVLLGRVLEQRARSKTSDAIKQLLDLRPETVRVFRSEEAVDIPLDQVVVGDRIHIRPGDRIPVDGVVEEGASSIDESLMTGESVPIDKTVGDPVIGGSVNTTGSFTFVAERVGAETALARIVAYVEQAQASRPPIQRLADQIASVFVPIVFAIATLTLVVWWASTDSFAEAMVNAVSVLIISCPCALGLATPTAILVGTGQGAKLGLLIRSGESVETAHRIQTAVLDKTGTLTSGRPIVTDVVSLSSYNDDQIVELAAGIERDSEHPIARAILDDANRKNLSATRFTRFEAVPGGGIRSESGQNRYLLGSLKFLKREGIAFDKEDVHLTEEGKTVIYLAENEAVVGCVAVADEIRPESKEAVERLTEMGIEVAMLTGDNTRTAEAVARQVGIGLVVAEVRPEDKANRITALQQERGIVAMVGDGINDAPALAQADVGIAIGTGTDVAIEAADIALMSGDLRGIPTIINLSRRTMRIIKQNLFWAFAYNVILIPVAATGLLTPWGGPMLAAGAMAFSSVTVVMNALRLKRFGAKS